jgi:hypothetical protein
MRRMLFTLMLLGSSVALATTVYKWVDDNGVIHYSDQPHPNAEKLQVQGVQTYSASAASVRMPSGSVAPRAAPAGNPYKGCVIAQPVDQQNLPNAESVQVRVATEPMPRPEDRVFITLDGQGLNGGQPTGLSINVTPIDRGEHSVSAQIRGPGDEVLCRTPPVSFFVQQRNLFSPAASGQPGVSPRPR